MKRLSWTMRKRSVRNDADQESISFSHRTVGYLVIGACFIVLLPAGCASRSSKSEPVTAVNGKKTDPSKVVCRKFAAANPPVVSSIGEMETVVRMETSAEILDDRYKLGAIFPVEGAGSLALGLVAPPMYASALVVGGALLIPLGTYLYIHEKRVWNAITEALINSEFTRAIDKALKYRLNSRYSEENIPNLKLEVIVQNFGIVLSESTHQYCLVVSAEVILSKRDVAIAGEGISISHETRSEGAPPPQCASLEHFAEHEAQLVKDTLAEYAEVLAAMAAKRVSGG